jgi:hypothetical protein
MTTDPLVEAVAVAWEGLEVARACYRRAVSGSMEEASAAYRGVQDQLTALDEAKRRLRHTCRACLQQSEHEVQWPWCAAHQRVMSLH